LTCDAGMQKYIKHTIGKNNRNAMELNNISLFFSVYSLQSYEIILTYESDFGRLTQFAQVIS